ncbi:MAG: RluA family pseudouridine synthase [Clostridia bacterium]|nr:RluA family pseudouridine synthase [Clostridia bacterium]
MWEWTVLREEEGRRVREILRTSMRLSYTAMKSAKWNGDILLNGTKTTVDVRVRAGDRIRVILPDPSPVFTPTPYDLPLTVPYEDEQLLVIDKPAPLASQSSLKHPGDSLENAVYSYYGCPEGFVYRPVNRLDKGTSGLMVVARDGHTQDLLQRMLHGEDFVREYIALTEGIPDPPEGVIDLPIGKREAASIRREVRPDGQRARTLYRVLEQRPGHRALVRVRLETGRTHQIRVHLAAIGCPVCGDFLYGTERIEEFPGRFALHSAYLKLKHPVTGKLLELESLPKW